MAKRGQYTTLSARVWNGQLDLIKAAAKELHMSVPEYTRFRLVPHAARDAGRPLPDFPPFAGQGRPSPISEAAARLNLSVGEFRKRMVDAAAEAIVRAAVGGLPISEGTLVGDLARSVSETVPRDRERPAERAPARTERPHSETNGHDVPRRARG